MRRRPLFWILISVLCFAGAMYFWRLGNRWAEEGRPKSEGRNPKEIRNPESEPGHSSASTAPSPKQKATSTTNAFPYRLSNTTKTIGQLSRSDHAILLENALFDTERRAVGGAPALP